MPAVAHVVVPTLLCARHHELPSVLVLITPVAARAAPVADFGGSKYQPNLWARITHKFSSIR